MTFRREVPRHHTVAYTLIKKPGIVDRSYYALYVLDGPECRPVPVLPLIEYFMEQGRSRSLAWQREVARATGLFIDYLVANKEKIRGELDRPQVLASFTEALVGGTINSSGDDPSSLYWEPKSTSRATILLTALTVFSDWLVNYYATTPINPWRRSSAAEKIAYWRRFDQRRPHMLLSHTYSRSVCTDRANVARSVAVRRKTISHDVAPAKFFPQKEIWNLMQDGFVARSKSRSSLIHDRLSIRDMLITILLQGGGLRESEPFHIYVSDVAIDPKNPKSALVRLYHPEQGRAPDDYIDPMSGKTVVADREEYLRVKWGRVPRNLDIGRFHAGWKDLKLSNGRDKYALIHWFPSYWGEIFLALFKVYITKKRSRHCQHPYLFVSHKDDVAGAPYTVGAYRQAHAKAVRRIGLVVSKDLGTTPHGHRHSYAQLMTDLKIDDQVIQAALHHKSIESQRTYKEATVDKVKTALTEASKKMSAIPPSFNISGAVQ